MLESDHHVKLTQVLAALECRVRLPPGWEDFFKRRGDHLVKHDDRRQFARSHCPTDALLQVRQTLPSLARERQFYRVYTKDLSRSGVSFLHEEQLFPCEQLALWFSSSLLNCTVVRCRRYNERCYEIGATFGMQPTLTSMTKPAGGEQSRRPR